MKQAMGHKLDLNLCGQKKGKIYENFSWIRKKNQQTNNTILEIKTNGKTSSSNSKFCKKCVIFRKIFTQANQLMMKKLLVISRNLTVRNKILKIKKYAIN